MSMIDFAAKMRKLIAEKKEANRVKMEQGVNHDTYMRLVGRNSELREINDWIVEVVNQIDSQEGEDDL